MNVFNEPKESQDDFNKKFLAKLMIFMFFYRFYIMHIDQKGVLVDCAEDCFYSFSNDLDDLKNLTEGLNMDEVQPEDILD